MTRRINFALLNAVFEAVVLISATLFLCGLYLQFGRDVDVQWWLILLLLALVLSLGGLVWSSYRTSRSLQSESDRAWFRINQQLVSTLTENAPKDVSAGLQELFTRDGETCHRGEDEFGAVLEEQFGPARANEVKETVFKYARFRPRE